MCAKDRSQIAVCSQTESIQYFVEMLNISSSPSFVRDSHGKLVHTNSRFDQVFLTNNERNSWFASIPVDTGMELVRSELRALTSRVACLVSNVQINNEVWTVFIECMTFNDDLFSKWVFIKDSDSIVDQLGRYKAFSVRMDRYIEKISRAASSEWAIINLYSAGLTHSTISKITGVEEQTSKNAVSKMKRELNFPDRDYIKLSSIYSLNYSKIIHNVISVLKLDC